MPKKTRREKIIADLRRQLQNNSSSQPQTSTIKNQEILPTKKIVQSSPDLIYKPLNIQPTKPATAVNKEQYAYVLSDLKRIFLVTFALFTTEGLLYYLLILKK